MQMINKSVMLYISLSMALVGGCKQGDPKGGFDPFDTNNLLAWCIVPFDAMERGPEDRAIMLKDLGISQLAYDYRDRHLPCFKDEIETLKKYNIDLRAVWFWIEKSDSTLLNATNEFVLHTLKSNNCKTELWVSFHENFFEGFNDDEKMKKAVEAVNEIKKRAQDIGCTIALYNHGGWFGEPENQVKIIEATGADNIRMVYNFHHGHDQVERFEELFTLMLPYLSAVNINGMRVEGPMILPVGRGDREKEMLKIIKTSGYRGPIGILGHVEEEDVRTILERNLEGLSALKKDL